MSARAGRWGGMVLALAAMVSVGTVGAAEAQEAAPGPPGAQPAAAESPAKPAGQVGESAASQTPVPAKEDAKRPVASAGKDGFVLQSESGDFRLKIAGYAQADSRFYLKDSAGSLTDSFLLRRVRPTLQGTAAKYFDFYLNPDFAEGKVTLYDAYVDVRYSARLKVRFGKMKPPFGLERLQSGGSLLFIERALPTAVAPNRDVGVQLHGDLAGGVLNYALGAFNGGVDGGSADGDTNDAKDVVGRLLVRPFKSSSAKALGGLSLAIAGSRGRQKGSLPSFKSGGQQTFYSYDSKASADGDRTRWSPQASWYVGRVGLFGEYVRSRQTVRKESVSGEITNASWQVAGSFVLTGEAASGGGVKPRKAFDPAKGAWGAFELAARMNELDIDDQAFALALADPGQAATRARAWAVGLNWYLSSSFKYVLNYERTTFSGGAKGGDRAVENALILRAQVSY